MNAQVDQHLPMPYSPLLEDQMVPSVAQITAAGQALCGGG